jgi:S-adenosylmethionine-diacylgycerolhomoserine-N-methlytransferase
LAAQQLSPRRILEIGCGTGRNLVELARAFPSAEIVGVDLSGEMLKKAERKITHFGSRVSLVRCAYVEPLSNGSPFDLIVFSYCLSMINPGYEDVLRVCEQDLSPSGSIAIVDFHDTPFPWFRRWMGLNHVRFDGQILRALEERESILEQCAVKSAYGGLWRWLICLAGPSPN